MTEPSPRARDATTIAVSGERQTGGGRRWREVGVPVVIVVVLVVIALLGLGAAQRSRALEARTLGDFATMAAWNYSYRTYSMLTNAAVPLVGIVGPRGARPFDEDLARLAGALDSLRDCCPVTLPSRGVASGRWSDPASVLFQPATSDAARIRTLHAVSEWDSIGGTLVRFASGGTAESPFLYLVLPQYDLRRQPVGFIAIDVDLPVAQRSLFGALFAQPPTLLPQSMAGVRSNAALAVVTVSDSVDRVLFRSPIGETSRYAATVPLGRRGDLDVHIALTPAAVRGLLRGARPGQAAATQFALALLALALAVVIGLVMRNAQRLALLRSRYAASVTHELRTPLTQILLNAETLDLRRERSPEERAAFVSSIIRESRRLVRLIDNVLHFSRAERRVLRIETRPTRVDTIVAATVRERAGGAPVEVVAPAPAWAHADADALALVIANVLDNALRHGGGTAVRISVGTNAEAIEIIIDDEGPGIPLRDRRRAFEPFVRLADAHARHPTGSGIGLAVVSDLLAAMHGAILLDDAPGGGLRVRIALPRSQPGAGE